MTLDATISRAELAAALDRVAGAVAGRTTQPVLSGVLIRSDLTLAATDGEIGVRTQMTGGTTGDGWAVVAPHATLARIVKESDAADVRLNFDGDALVVKAGGRFTLPTWPAEMFPDVPTESEGGFTVTAGELRLAIRRVGYAADKKDSTRFALSGVQWEYDRGHLRLVATDSKRVAVHELAAAGGDGAKVAVLIPQKAVTLLDRNLGDDADEVTVVLRANDAVFRTGNTAIHTRLIEGRFPPYRDVVGQARKGANVRLSLPVAAFLSRVRQAAIMVDDETKRIDFAFGAGAVRMQARGAATGSSEVELPLPEYDGPDVQIAFDPAYLTDLLRSLGAEPVVTLEMSDGTKPATFTCGRTTAVIMPLSG